MPSGHDERSRLRLEEQVLRGTTLQRALEVNQRNPDGRTKLGLTITNRH